MKKFRICFFVIVAFAVVGIGGYYFGSKKAYTTSGNNGATTFNLEIIETPEAQYEALWEGKMLRIENIEPKDDKYIITGTLWEQYVLTGEEVNAVKDGRRIKVGNGEYAFEKISDTTYNAQGEFCFIHVEKDGRWNMSVQAGSGNLFRTTNVYVEFEVDGSLPWTVYDDENQQQTVKDLAAEFDKYDAYYTMKAKDGEFIELCLMLE